MPKPGRRETLALPVAGNTRAAGVKASKFPVGVISFGAMSDARNVPDLENYEDLKPPHPFSILPQGDVFSIPEHTPEQKQIAIPSAAAQANGVYLQPQAPALRLAAFPIASARCCLDFFDLDTHESLLSFWICNDITTPKAYGP
jgi:hypothetical protein